MLLPFSTTIPPHNCHKMGKLDVMITDVDCGKVRLYVLELYRGCDTFGEIMRGFAGVLKKDGGEAGIRTLETLRFTRFPSARTRPDYATSPNFALQNLDPEAIKNSRGILLNTLLSLVFYILEFLRERLSV